MSQSSATLGRALHLTWSTPSGAASPHVATISTDPVTAGQPGTALTWTYGYSGDLLTSVCPPGTTTACTRYGYITNGSHAPTAVLNASPTSYYRLDEPAGSAVAVNQVPADDLATMDPPAGEFGTAPGVAGPVPGVTATGFNGTSSFIPLDGAWCTTPGQLSSCAETGDSGRVLGSTASGLGISVWFKTSTAGGVLLGVTPFLPGSTSTYTGYGQGNALWIASNGDLDGAGSCSAFGQCTALSSPSPVDDGNWHQAVLIPGQALYLDGKLVATGTVPAGNTVLPAAGNVLLGAGMVTNPNTENITWSYFNGSLADLSLYQNQLPGTGTVAAQYAAETRPSAELTSITSPGGRTELSATYDTVNDRVATLTDAHGGTWAYGGPVTGSSAAAYDDAVLSSSPQDFWPLSDTAGPLARDLAGGSATAATARPPATFSNVTLGVPGPTGFPDGTAAGFSGSGSQIAIPGGYFAGNGAADSQTTDGYDGDGNLVSQELPGGVQLSNTYDKDGNLTGQSGTGSSAATASRTFTYDSADRMLTAATSAVGSQGSAGYQPATSESFGYDDRGLLLSASGSAGTSVFTYNGSGQPTSAQDAAGTSSYGYDTAGRLLTDTDAASGVGLSSQTTSTGTTLSFTSDAYGQQITDAGSSYTWDALDRVVAAAEPTGRSISLTYDGQTNLVSSDSSASYSRDPAIAASAAASVAQGLYLAAQIMLTASQDFEAAANAAWAAMKHDAAEAAEHWYEPWVAAQYAYDAGVEFTNWVQDRNAAGQMYAAYQALMAQYYSADIHAILLGVMAAVAAVQAVVAGIAATVAEAIARNTAAAAKRLAAQAAGAESAAAAAEAEYQRLLSEYQAEQRRAKQRPPHDPRHTGHTGTNGNPGGRGSGSGSGGGKGSGPGNGSGSGGPGCSLTSLSGLFNCGKQAVTSTVGSAVNCAEHPSLASCASTVATIVVAVGTDGVGDVAADAAEQAARSLAEDGGDGLIDWAEACLGGESFTAGHQGPAGQRQGRPHRLAQARPEGPGHQHQDRQDPARGRHRRPGPPRHRPVRPMA